jgi:hypothetical protein
MVAEAAVDQDDRRPAAPYLVVETAALDGERLSTREAGNDGENEG